MFFFFVCFDCCRWLLDQMTIIYVLLSGVWPEPAREQWTLFFHAEKERRETTINCITDYDIDRAKWKHSSSQMSPSIQIGAKKYLDVEAFCLQNLNSDYSGVLSNGRNGCTQTGCIFTIKLNYDEFLYCEMKTINKRNKKNEQGRQKRGFIDHSMIRFWWCLHHLQIDHLHWRNDF